VNIPASDLELFAAGRTVEDLLREGVYATKETLSNLLTFTKLQFPVRNNIYALRATRTRFLHYQFNPLLKFLDSPKQRLLIADEVGLGKTIEAGLILTELRARHPGSLDRVLIVCPAALCRKWKAEMKTRFDEEFAILDADGMRSFLNDLEENGEGAKLRGVCSIQTLRGSQLLDEWTAASPELDLLIIDEAHHLRNPDTHSHRMGRLLAESADAVLLLTATPVHLGNVNLFYLLRILDPEQFGSNPNAMRDDIGEMLFQRLMRANEPIVEALRALRSVPCDLRRCERLLHRASSGQEGERFRTNPIFNDILEKLPSVPPTNVGQLIELQRDVAALNLLGAVLTRTRKREVETRVIREARVIKVVWTELEQELYGSITQAVLDRYNLIAGDPFAAFMVMMPQRQVASCIPAAVERYEQVETPQFGGLSEEMSDLEPEDWSDDDDKAEYSVGSLDLHEAIRRWRSAGSPDSKFDQLLATLRALEEAEPGRKLILFSYFKGTLYYLSRRLKEAGFANEIITGDYSDEERQENIDRFQNNPSIRILLSSEVGSEGLDFQFCHMMVNYDLPWNPMVVEQRIGRLDRIGQKSPKIIIFNFSVPGTIEDRIFTRLYQRIRIFEESIGDLEPILGEEMRNLTRDLLQSELTPEQQEARIQQSAEVLERRRQEISHLEQDSTRFIGHDEFFSDEIDRVLKRKRYVSGEELRTLIVHFVEKHHPVCSLEQKDGDYELTVTTDLERFVVENVDTDDPQLFAFRRRCGKGAIPVTFDSERAERERDIVFITSHHPLIRAIVRYYENCPEELHPVAKVELDGSLVRGNETISAIPPGDYFYFVYRLDAQGVRHDRTVQSFFIASQGETSLGEETSEALLTAMAVDGRTIESAPSYTSECVTAVQERADAVFGEYLEARRRELAKRNNAVVNARLVSLEQSAATRIGRREDQLRNARSKDARPQYIRLLEGTLRRLRLDYEQRKGEIEKGRALELTFERVAAGIVRIG
jgi:superfamily II DNA or RNA helicase